ncbi:MAG: bifunctional phosphoribosyl-AMP cyclohydrolase/phosphoribosyl-ATP diphosphatase HisIE [Acidobacteriota bacterium]|nr:MAG: bifunctional phosphoribosyl-AMP cyclohydrolase/phosphoribosyl-ATP diphosphatase HisIE [Acidobacteriota bacterium]
MKIDWKKGNGLVPAVVQDAETDAVLMLGYMNREALTRTRRTKRVHFYSRARGRLWRKGETSGNTLRLVSVSLDCDGDTLLVRAVPTGPVCHRETPTCFPEAAPSLGGMLGEVGRVVAERARKRPRGSYTTALFSKGISRIAQKVGEEALETALAAQGRSKARLAEEAADLLYHLLVLLEACKVPPSRVAKVLAKRRGKPGGKK